MGKSSEKKLSAYYGMLKLITSLFQNFASIEDTASQKQELRFLERFEARAGWVSADNAGLIAHKHYHLTFVGCLGEGKHLRRHEEIMRRPEVSSRWDAAVTIDNLHTTDLYVDNDVAADGADALPVDKPAAHFGEFYEHYRKAFLSMETHPWYDAHGARWGEKTSITAQRRSETSSVDRSAELV